MKASILNILDYVLEVLTSDLTRPDDLVYKEDKKWYTTSTPWMTLSQDDYQEEEREVIEHEELVSKVLNCLENSKQTRILIIGKDINDAKSYAHSLFLNPDQWVFINSKAKLARKIITKDLVCLAPMWFHRKENQEILKYAKRKNFNIV